MTLREVVIHLYAGHHCGREDGRRALVVDVGRREGGVVGTWLARGGSVSGRLEWKGMEKRRDVNARGEGVGLQGWRQRLMVRRRCKGGVQRTRKRRERMNRRGRRKVE